MEETEFPCDGMDAKDQLIKALEDYIVLLGEELNETVPLSFAHGWRSTRHEQGRIARTKIADLKNYIESLNQTPV